jgi:hypothetical protein
MVAKKTPTVVAGRPPAKRRRRPKAPKGPSWPAVVVS